MLWKFFQQALASPHVKVDSVFREMLNLSRSFPGCRPFANEPAPPASFCVREPLESAAVSAVLDPPSLGNASSNRLAQIKRGSTLAEVASNRISRSGKTVSNGCARGNTSLSLDKRNIKKVGAV